jgi:hypothetical protein
VTHRAGVDAGRDVQGPRETIAWPDGDTAPSNTPALNSLMREPEPDLFSNLYREPFKQMLDLPSAIAADISDESNAVIP